MRAEKKRKENGAAGGQIDRLFFLTLGVGYCIIEKKIDPGGRRGYEKSDHT